MKNENASDPELAGRTRSAANSQKPSREEIAEILRKKCRYRELILSGRLVLPHTSAAQLLGPDCLYHLYSVNGKDGCTGKRRRHAPKQSRRVQ